MDFFYTTVIGIAIVILIIILIIVGVMIYQSKYNNVFPPTALDCPNYWNSDKDGNGNTICYIPTNGVNTGSFDGKNVAGLASNTNGNYINFSDANWGASGASATCAKSTWANKNKILWDGISNYNGCA
jgi:hypothetical protein